MKIKRYAWRFGALEADAQGELMNHSDHLAALAEAQARNCQKDHVIDRSAPIEAQLKQAEAWINQLHHSYVEIQKTCAAKDARIAELEGKLRNMEEGCGKRAAIDAARRESK